MIFNFEGKKAIVCGASQGIGRATCKVLANAGAQVFLLSRNENELKKLLKELPVRPNGPEHVYFPIDFNFTHEIDRALEKIFSITKTVDILINNSSGPAPGKIENAHLEEFKAAFAQHLLSAHKMCLKILPGMKQQKFGRIINILSTSVKAVLPGLGVSNTLRAAMANWSKTLSQEVAADGITVNNILPGATLTGRLQDLITAKAQAKNISYQEEEALWLEQIPAKRFAQPEELAYAVAFLCSPEAGYINGVSLAVDGGRLPNF